MLKVDGKAYTRKAIYKLYFHCGPLKKQNRRTIRIKTDARSLEKWRPIYTEAIWKDTMTLWIVEIPQLIQNIRVEVSNTVPISKDISLHVPKFLEKMVFQLMFEIIKWIR